MKTVFKASLDKPAKIITAGIVLVFAVLLVAIWIEESTEVKTGMKVYISIFLIAILAFCYAFSIQGYELSDTEIIIKRRSGNKIIKTAAIKEIKTLEKAALKGTIRTMGVGGLFGYFGEFSNSQYGSMDWYVTRRDKIIFIATHKQRLLLSPDDRDAFFARLNNAHSES